MQDGYFFDTSFFAEGMKRYPPSVEFFRPIWDRVDELIDDGKGFCCREVLEELDRKAGDDAHNYVNERKGKLLLKPSPAEEEVIAELVKKFGDSGWSLENTRKDNADPWVVAFAKTRGLVAVTAEFRRSEGRLVIPDACKHLGVPYMDHVQFIDACSGNST